MTGAPMGQFGERGEGSKARRAAPAEVFATPTDVPGEYDPEIPFWRPDLRASAKLLGWRWLIVGAIVLGLAAFVWLITFHGAFFLLSGLGLIIKLAGVMVAGAISVWV